MGSQRHSSSVGIFSLQHFLILDSQAWYCVTFQSTCTVVDLRGLFSYWVRPKLCSCLAARRASCHEWKLWVCLGAFVHCGWSGSQAGYSWVWQLRGHSRSYLHVSRTSWSAWIYHCNLWVWGTLGVWLLVVPPNQYTSTSSKRTSCILYRSQLTCLRGV